MSPDFLTSLSVAGGVGVGGVGLGASGLAGKTKAPPAGQHFKNAIPYPGGIPFDKYDDIANGVNNAFSH